MKIILHQCVEKERQLILEFKKNLRPEGEPQYFKVGEFFGKIRILGASSEVHQETLFASEEVVFELSLYDHEVIF